MKIRSIPSIKIIFSQKKTNSNTIVKSKKIISFQTSFDACSIPFKFNLVNFDNDLFINKCDIIFIILICWHCAYLFFLEKTVALYYWHRFGDMNDIQFFLVNILLFDFVPFEWFNKDNQTFTFLGIMQMRNDVWEFWLIYIILLGFRKIRGSVKPFNCYINCPFVKNNSRPIPYQS